MTQSADDKTPQSAEEEAVDATVNNIVSDSDTGGEAQPMSFNALRSLYEESTAKVEENFQQLLRAKAEVENMQRRATRDIANARKYALEGFVNDLIPVLDSLEQGMAIETKANNSETDAMRQGVELTMKLFVDAMTKHGVERLDPTGHPFNPEHHEAMSMIETSDIEPNHVMQVFQKGYLLNKRVVRPARVIVARGPTKPIDENA